MNPHGDQCAEDEVEEGFNTEGIKNNEVECDLKII